MSTNALIRKLQSEIELIPASDSSSLPTIHPVQLNEPTEEATMTEGDWDRFEADIHEAFEQLP